jgi:glutathione S-transferase
MIKLYGHVNRLSINTLKIRVALAEAGASYEYQAVDLAAGDQRRPQFLAINPHGKIPVLTEDDFALPESDAILWYVAERFPEARLLGPTARDRARALQWCDFASTGLYPAYYDVYSHTLAFAPEKRIAAVAEIGRQRLDRALGVLNQVLGTREALAGAYSIADIGAAVVVRGIQSRLPFKAEDHRNIAAWFDRVTARAAWKAALAESP